MAPSAFKTPAATASLSSMPGAVGTPSPLIEPWTFQDTAIRASEAGCLHGSAAKAGSSTGPGSMAGGGLPAPGLGGGHDDPSARPDADLCRPPLEEVAAWRAARDTS